jgi:hypothetical protein
MFPRSADIVFSDPVPYTRHADRSDTCAYARPSLQDATTDVVVLSIDGYYVAGHDREDGKKIVLCEGPDIGAFFISIKPVRDDTEEDNIDLYYIKCIIK